jgi:uncharacterized protein YycO
MKANKIMLKKVVILLLSIIIVAVVTIAILENLTESSGHFYPNYEKSDLNNILEASIIMNNDNSKIISLSKDAYENVFKQTGLGAPAIDQILSDTKGDKKDFLNELISYQNDFFTQEVYACTQVGIITSEEKMVDGQGDRRKAFKIPSIKVGDIFITKATHSIGYRHGHGAIVVDVEGKKTLESILLGYNSTYQSIDKWRGYPSFIQLRLKPGEYLSENMTNEELGKIIAEFAKEYTYDIPYGLLTGIPVKSPTPEKIRKTQCSHLVWYAYNNFGINLDSDGSWLVTPKDIANSKEVEIVQVFGVNPSEIWP